MLRGRSMWFLAGFALLLMLFLLWGKNVSENRSVPIEASALYAAIEEGRVKHFTIERATGEVEGIFTDEQQFFTTVADVSELEKFARENNVSFAVEQPSGNGWQFFFSLLVVPILIFALIYFFIIRPVSKQAGAGTLSGFTDSKVKFAFHTPDVSFDDVAGCDEAKEEIMEVVEFLKNPGRYEKFGARVPKGTLLVGPPGCGKTMLAKAVAREARVPFGYISGSDFVEVFVGTGAARVRDLFAKAKQLGRCIIFIDEIDAVGGRRHTINVHLANTEQEQTLKALLAEMDGFDSKAGIVVIAATNQPDVLDPALTRPGRFDRKILVDLPDVKGREAILRVHARKITLLDPGINFQKIAQETPGFSGAELENVVNEAIMKAIRSGKEMVSLEEFEEAIDIIAFGRERRIKITEKELQICVYHELGHALVAYFTPEAPAIRKITIIPRGKGLGATHFLNDGEEHLATKSGLWSILAVAMGGRAAETLKFNTPSSGACEDAAKATEIAKKMVCEWGMSERVGLAVFQRGNFLGYSEQLGCSEEMKRLIDEEVKQLLNRALQQATELLRNKAGLMDCLAEELRRRETLDGEEFRRLIEKHEKGS